MGRAQLICWTFLLLSTLLPCSLANQVLKTTPDQEAFNQETSNQENSGQKSLDKQIAEEFSLDDVLNPNKAFDPNAAPYKTAEDQYAKVLLDLEGSYLSGLQEINESSLLSSREHQGSEDEAAQQQLQERAAQQLVQRCRFIEKFLRGEEGYFDRVPEDFRQCLDALEKQHANQPDAQIYLLNKAYGKRYDWQATQLLKESVTWSADDRLALYENVVSTWRWESHFRDKNAFYALQAYEIRPSFEMGRIVVDYLDGRGFRQEATKRLHKLSALAQSSQQKSDLINLYIRFDQLLQAKKLLDKLGNDNEFPLWDSGRAKILALDDDPQPLRDFVRRSLKDHPNKELARWWLDYESGLGDAEFLQEAYLSYINKNYFRDPLLFTWFRLTFSNGDLPLLPPKPLGLLYALAIVLCVILAPLLLLLPIHYVGLVLQSRRGRSGVLNDHLPSPPYEPIFASWNLKTAWVLLSALLGLEVVLMNIFNEDWLAGDVFSLRPTSTASYMAENMLFYTLCTFAVAVLFNIKHLPKALFSKHRSLKKTIPLVVVAVLLCFLFNGLYRWGIEEAYMIGEVVGEFYSKYGFVATLLLVGVLGPIFEEILCRGVLLNALHRHIGFGLANGVQAAVFSLLHSDASLYPYYFVVGVCAGLLYRYSRALYLPILFHVLINTTAVTIVGTVLTNTPMTLKEDIAQACQHTSARVQFERKFVFCAVAAETQDANAIYSMASFYLGSDRVPKALPQAMDLYLRAIDLDFSKARNDLAWIMATSPNPDVRDGEEAVRLMEPLLPIESMSPAWIDTLAAAYAETGDFERAVSIQQQALAMGEEVGMSESRIVELQEHLALFEQGKVIRVQEFD